jgi:hypothetical protein
MIPVPRYRLAAGRWVEKEPGDYDFVREVTREAKDLSKPK